MKIMRMAAKFLFVTALIAGGSKPAHADEAGLSVWLPGLYGSLAAVPGPPGFTLGTVNYFASVDAGGGTTIPIGGRLEAGLKGNADLEFLSPIYGFEDPVFGAHAAISLATAFGWMEGSVSGELTGPRGNTITRHRRDTVWGFADLFPQATLAWNQGVNNFMVYGFGDVPVGAYDKTRLVNQGLGHGAIDFGGAYTYLNTMNGREFSVTSGFTYNFTNPDTNYQNGIDWHLDWGASQFLSQQIHIGLVGYILQQVTGDSGSGAILGDFKTRVVGIGPQVGYLFPLGSVMGYLNLKGYGEFAGQNRATGWNLWLTFAIQPGRAH